MNLPRWISDEAQCQFCKEMMSINTVEIVEHWEFGPSVSVQFRCTNDKCRCLRQLGKKATFGELYYNGYAKQFEDYQAKIAKEEEAKPDQEEVPVSYEQDWK